MALQVCNRANDVDDLATHERNRDPVIFYSDIFWPDCKPEGPLFSAEFVGLSVSPVYCKKFHSIRTKLTEEIHFEVCPYGDSDNGIAAAIAANFKIYLLRQFCSNRVQFFYNTQTQKKMDQNFEIRIL